MRPVRSFKIPVRVKFSVLIAAYNAGAYVAKALESIRAQQHADWEVVVVEDGSRDQTQSIVERFASSVSQSVRYDNFGHNRGVAAARNRLFELARGDALAFLDADDWWTPSHLTSSAATFARGVDIAVARVQVFNLQTGAPIGTYEPSAAFFSDPIQRLFLRSEIMTSSCVSLTRDIVRRSGPFDPAFRIGEDRDYWLRCAFRGAKFADTGEISCHYAKHSGSTMARTLLWSEQEVAFYEKYRDVPIIPARDRKQLLAHNLVNYGRLVRAAHPRKSARALWRAWKLRPWQLSIGAQLLRSSLPALISRT
jgi:glycosyltransferase involved in cell wall biosynthesis